MQTCHPEIDTKELRDFGRAVVPKIVEACTIEGMGDDLLTHVYLSGLYHGVTIGRRSAPQPSSAEETP